MASEIPDFGERFVFRPRSPTSRRGKKTAFADGHAAAQPGTRNGTCKTDFSDEWTPALNIKTKTTKTRRWTLKPNKMETPYLKKKNVFIRKLGECRNDNELHGFSIILGIYAYCFSTRFCRRNVNYENTYLRPTKWYALNKCRLLNSIFCQFCGMLVGFCHLPVQISSHSLCTILRSNPNRPIADSQWFTLTPFVNFDSITTSKIPIDSFCFDSILFHSICPDLNGSDLTLFTFYLLWSDLIWCDQIRSVTIRSYLIRH